MIRKHIPIMCSLNLLQFDSQKRKSAPFFGCLSMISKHIPINCSLNMLQFDSQNRKSERIWSEKVAHKKFIFCAYCCCFLYLSVGTPRSTLALWASRTREPLATWTHYFRHSSSQTSSERQVPGKGGYMPWFILFEQWDHSVLMFDMPILDLCHSEWWHA